MPSFASVKSVSSATNPPAFVKYYPLTNSPTDPTATNWTTKPASLKFISRKGFVTRRNDPITDMTSMFEFSNTFNDPDIGAWDVSSVSDMRFMFVNNTFNQDIGLWAVNNPLLDGMFDGNSAFNQDLRWWNVRSSQEPSNFGGAVGWTTKPLWAVIQFSSTFNYYPLTNTATDPTYSAWRSSNAPAGGYRFRPNDGIYTLPGEPITNMSTMFVNSTFNDPDIASWDVSAVTDMSEMFSNASSFNQDISGWCVTNITSEPTDFSLSAPLFADNKPVWGTCP